MPSLMTIFKKDTEPKEKTVSKNPMLDLIPISTVGADYFKRKDNRYCTILSVTPVNMSLLEEDDEDAVVEAIQEVANTIPDRFQIVISSERLNLDDYIDYLRAFADRAKDGAQLERLNSMIEEIQTRSVKNQKVLQFYVVIESQYEKEAPAANELADIAKQMEDILRLQSIYVTRLDKPAMLALWYQKLNPQGSMLEPPTHDMELQHILPSVIDPKTYTVNGVYIVGETYMKSFTVDSFPTTRKFASWLSPILKMDLDIDVSITLNPTEKDVALDSFNRSLRALSLKKDELKKDYAGMKKVDQQIKDGEWMIDLLSNDNEKYFHCTFVFTIRESSLEDLRNSEKALRSKVSGQKMRSRALLRYAFEPLWYTMPLCYKGMLQDKVKYGMPANTIGSMQPFNSSTLSGKDGIILGTNVQSHDLVMITQDTLKRYPHTIWLGETGSGKSYGLYANVLRKIDQGKIVIDIDPERERESIAGNHIYFGLNHNFCVNVFHIRSTVVDQESDRVQESTKPGAYLRLKIDRNQSFFSWLYPDMDAFEQAAVEEAQVKVYAQHGLTYESEILPDTFPTLSDFHDILVEMGEDTKKIRQALRPFLGDGNYARMFDGQTNWSFTEEVVHIGADGERTPHNEPYTYTRLDIHELPQRAQAPLMDLLLNDMWEFVKMDRKLEKHLYIDEAWIVSDPERPHTLNFIYEMVKRGRKYGVYMTVATQNVADFLRTKAGVLQPPGQAIISNSQIKVLLRLDEKELDTISQFVNLSQKEKKTLHRNEKRGHGVVLVGTQHAEIQTFMTKAEFKQYDPEKYQLLYEAE